MPRLRDLKPDLRNARRHTTRNLGQIEAALRDVGAARSIVVDEDGTILAGNATVQAAKDAGITDVRFIETDGTEIIAVRRSGLTPAQKTRLALWDNRAAELAEWDTDVLAAFQDDGIDLSQFWVDNELDALLHNLAAEPFDPTAEWTGMPEFEQEDQRPVKRLTVSFLTVDDVERFANLVGQKITMATDGIYFPPIPQGKRKGVAYVSDEEAA